MSMSSNAPPPLQKPLAPPSTFDPSGAAEAQQGYNYYGGVTSQAGSNYNQVNPYGTTTYTQTGTGAGGAPIYSANVQLSPAQQALLNQLQTNQQVAGGQIGSLITGAGYGNQTPQEAIGNQTSGIVGQLTGQETSYLQPTFNMQTSQLDTQLRNQGLQPGEPGYDNAMRSLSNNQAGQIQNFIATTQPQIMQEATTQYQLPWNMMLSGLPFTQPQSATANNVTGAALNVQPTNYIGAQTAAQNSINQNYGTEQGAYNAYNQQQLADWQAQQQQQAAMMQGIFGIGSTLLGSSGGVNNATSLLKGIGSFLPAAAL